MNHRRFCAKKNSLGIIFDYIKCLFEQSSQPLVLLPLGGEKGVMTVPNLQFNRSNCIAMAIIFTSLALGHFGDSGTNLTH